MENYVIENWLDDSQIKSIGYSDYWNDEENEKSKKWYILDGNFSKMEQYLLKTGLLLDFERCLRLLKEEFKYELKGAGIDLASGNLWSTKPILRSGQVNTLYCLEYSKHRLLKLGPKVLEHYGIPKDRIVLVMGSFYELRLKDNALDFVFMSQAFHHADRPDDLLLEIRRVLKPGGAVIIIGEHKLNCVKAYVRNLIKFFLTRILPAQAQQRLFGKTFYAPKLMPSLKELFPTDPVLGDHYYTDKQYGAIFTKHGFRLRRFKRRGSEFQSFVLIKDP